MSFAEELPKTSGPERERAILEAVRLGRIAPLDWISLESQFDGHRAQLRVTADALRVGDPGNWLRVNLTATTAQIIADILGGSLQTRRICNLVWEQATVRLTPTLLTPDAHMADTSRMIEHDRLVESKRAGRAGLVENVGKHWLLAKQLAARPDRAANYGWYDRNAPFLSGKFRLWQQLGLAHNLSHVDYSQVLRLVHRTCVVDGVERDIREIFQDAALAGLVSDEGPLETVRLPVGDAAEVAEKVPPTEAATAQPISEVLRPPSHMWRSPLVRGMTGMDVTAWQQVLVASGEDIGPSGVDGIFGARVESATRHWQTRHRIDAVGKVNAETRAAIDLMPANHDEPSPTPAVETSYPFVQAKNFTPSDRKKVDWIVLHSMENQERPNSAEAVADWFAGRVGDTPKASAHYCADADSVVQCVREKDIAWTAPGANGLGVHIEHAGFARQSAAEWNDEYSHAMLTRTARLCAEVCHRWNIPVEYVDAEGLKAGRRGITMHRDVSQAFHKSDHTDPGPHFPISDFIERVKWSY